ncbi:MAG: phosphotransferase family protein [Sphingobium sp.]
MTGIAESPSCEMSEKGPDGAGRHGGGQPEMRDGLLIRQQQPGVVRTLEAIRRDMQQIILPELGSDRARTVAISMDSALRHLIVRLSRGDEFLARQVLGEQALLDMKEGALDWATHLDLGARLEEEGGASIDERTETAFARLEASMIEDFEAAEQSLPLLGSEVGQDDRRFDPVGMTRYLRKEGVIPPDGTIERIIPVAGGFSKETLFIEPSGGAAEALVMRRDNPFGPIDSTVIDEFPLLRCVYDNGLPVAEPVMMEADAGVFGQPFMLSRKVKGRAIPHTTGLLEGDEHAMAGHGLARVLGQLHSLDVRRAELPGYLRPDIVKRSTHILAQIDYWEDCWRRYRSDYSPILTRGFRWLRANVPDSPLPPCLVHGDAGPHNLMIDDGKVTAMLDWEFATLGDPMADLVYSRLFIDRIMNWDDFIATYRAHGGPEPDEGQVEFFTRFFAMRNAITSIRLLGAFAINPNPDLIACFGTIKYDRMFRRQLEALI